MSITFTQVFGGNNIYTAQPTFLSLNPLTTNVNLQWPLEQSPGGVDNVVADIIEVNATAVSLRVQFADARQTSTGYTSLFNNIGVNTFSVVDAAGNVLASIASGTVWQLYLADNSTIAGTWRVFQYGAGVSNANAAALAGAGLKAITTTLNERIAINAKNADYVIVNADRAECIEWTGGNGTFTLPDAATVGSDWFCIVKNSGTGLLTVAPPSGTIDTQASLVFNPDNSAFVVCDGANFFTVGLGQTINSIFDFVSIGVGGSGDFVLTGANLNRISYRFTGVLTGNRNIIVPNTVQQYWVDNETTGAFSLIVKTAAGAGVGVAQGLRNILYCDSVSVVAAVAFASTGFPDGSAASPGIAFASHQTTGFYLAGADVLAFATAGAERAQVDNKGHWELEPTDTVGPTLLVNGSNAGASIVEKITSFVGGSSINPQLEVTTSSAGGFALVSVCANNGTPGTNDLSIFQDGSTLDATILNRANANLFLGSNGGQQVEISSTGRLSVLGPLAGTRQDITPDTGTFVVTGTGFAVNPTGTAFYRRIGNIVFLHLPALGPSTSNANTFTITGLPASLQPATITVQESTVSITDNTIEVTGQCRFNNGSGTISLELNGSLTGFTPSGLKGFGLNTIMYLVD